jgi:hypothetical protein
MFQGRYSGKIFLSFLYANDIIVLTVIFEVMFAIFFTSRPIVLKSVNSTPTLALADHY